MAHPYNTRTSSLLVRPPVTIHLVPRAATRLPAHRHARRTGIARQDVVATQRNWYSLTRPPRVRLRYDGSLKDQSDHMGKRLLATSCSRLALCLICDEPSRSGSVSGRHGGPRILSI